ncbi:MAG TPA: acetylxylan esterase [Verrucomicrobiae bacterium]
MAASMKADVSLFAVFAVAVGSFAAEKVRDLNTPREFPEIRTKGESQKRAQEIREHVQFCTGLWPMPEKTPLNAKIFDRVERDGYSIEKVYFQTYPGFFLAGNLYRPMEKDGKRKRYPAILNPHGHWKNGRMADEELGSIAARCISFARQGMIAFSYDMVGYNDTIQVDHKFASGNTNLLWNISLMGLQTWNSIRALDFLESLPDVDKKRLACTGESGGGTQTFILGAIDDRLAAQGPIVMVSHSMQGGCLCENAPGLRVDYSNMEIAASVAPRPQVIVAAMGDWTKKTMEVEGPAIESIYKLFRAEEKFDYAIFNYDHNYNKTTREFVYGSFGKWLLNEKDAQKLKEQPYKKEPDSELRVFPEGKLPEGALKEPELIQSLVRNYSEQLEKIKPVDARSLKKWKEEMRPAWEHALQLQHVSTDTGHAKYAAVTEGPGQKVVLRRQPDGVETTMVIDGANPTPRTRLVVLRLGVPRDRTISEKLWKGWAAIAILLPGASDADQFTNYYHAYNRTFAQDVVADVKVARDYLQRRFPKAKLVLHGDSDYGATLLLAAPLADAVVVDASGMDESQDSALLDENVFFPGIRRIGSLQGIAALAVPNPLFVHNVKNWRHDWLDAVYGKKDGGFRTQPERASGDEIVKWILAHAE